MARRNPVTAVRSYKKQKQRTSKKQHEENPVPILFPMPVEKLRRYMGAYDQGIERTETDVLWERYDDYESFSKAYEAAFKHEALENQKDDRATIEAYNRPKAVTGKEKILKTRKKKPVASIKGNVHKKSIYFENLSNTKFQPENHKPPTTERKKCKKGVKNKISRANANKLENEIVRKTPGKSNKVSSRQYEDQIRHSRTQYDYMEKNITNQEPIMELKLDPSYECLPPKYVEKLHEMRIRYEIKSREPRRTVLVGNNEPIHVGTKAVMGRTKAKEQFKRMSFSVAQLDRIKDMKLKYNEIKYRDPEVERLRKLPPALEGKKEHVGLWIGRHKSLPSLTLQSLPSTSL